MEQVTFAGVEREGKKRRTRREQLSGAARSFLFSCCLLTISACDFGPASRSASRVAVDTIGDTIVVRTLSGSAWGAQARLVPQVSIGEGEEGPEELLFGDVHALAADSERNVYVFDRQAAAVRIFDSSGTHLRTFGRRGQGPGELAEPTAMAVLPGGRVVVRDEANSRLTLFGPGARDGDAWRYTPGSFFTTRPLWTDRESRTYVFAQDVGRSGRTVLLVLRPDGALAATLSLPPEEEFRPPSLEAPWRRGRLEIPLPFAPEAHWTVHPAGAFLVGVSDEYRVELRRFAGGVLRIERVYDRVGVSREEADSARAGVERRFRQGNPNWRWDGPPIPQTKPPFNALYAGLDGRIWVSLSGVRRAGKRSDDDVADGSPALQREPVRFDVFEEDGTYLGVVDAPPDFSRSPPPVFDGEFVWAVSLDELGVERVARYRINVVRQEPPPTENR